MNDIDLIINHLQEELIFLKGELEKCISSSDPDYEGAIVFQKAVRSKSAEIRILTRRRDSNTDEINDSKSDLFYKRNQIKKQEDRLLDYPGPPRNIPRIKEQLKFYKQELDEINNKIIELNLTNRSKHLDEDILLTEIENLFEKNTRFLCLEFGDNRFNFDPTFKFLSILNLENEIQIEYGHSSVRLNDRKISHHLFRSKLVKIGFQLDHHLNWNLFLKKEQTSPKLIHQIVSILCFELISLTDKTTCHLMIS